MYTASVSHAITAMFSSKILMMPSFFKNFYAISRLIENTQGIFNEMLHTINKSRGILEENSKRPKPACLTTKEAEKKNGIFNVYARLVIVDFFIDLTF